MGTSLILWLTANQKIIILKCHLNSTQLQQTISWSDYDMWQKVDLYKATTSSVVGSRRSHKALPKAKLEPKSSHGQWRSAAHLIHCSFLNPIKTITSETYAQQLDEMHQKLQCLWPALVTRKDPVLHDNTWLHIAQPALQTLNELGYEVLPHLSHSPDLSPTTHHFFTHLNNFLQRKGLHNQQEAENTFQELSESRSTDS